MAAFTTIDNAGAFFAPHLYTGDGNSPLAITGVGFQPDFVWIKNLGVTDNHAEADSVRGANEYLSPMLRNAETTQTEFLLSFDSDGFTLGDLANTANNSGESYVSWNAKAGTTTGIDTTGSTITPIGYSFNQDAGFSIVKYAGNTVAGATLPHGLGAVPEMIIVKSLNVLGSWLVYHKSMDPTAPEDYYMAINATASRAASSAGWNDTAPTSVNVVLGSDNAVNGSYDYVAYSFAGKQGYSKFGSYEGNSNANGTFVYLGFRPAFILCKSMDGTSDWYLFDNKRLGYNNDNDNLIANTSAAQETSDRLNILSNGFKWITSGSLNNANTCIYAAFAESPFVNSSGVATNAR